MMDVFKGNASNGLPYGLLLTCLFEWYGVELLEEDNTVKFWMQNVYLF